MLKSSFISLTHRLSKRGAIWVALVVMICSWASGALAQSTEGYRIELVEIWIQGKVSAERAWNRNLSKIGISFQVSAEVEERLRRAGAGDEWIAVLRRASFVPPPDRLATVPLRRFSRSELRPLYFGNEARITPYVGLMRLQERGGSVEGQIVATTQGPVHLKSTPLAASASGYGLVVDYRSVGLDLEGVFQEDLLMLNLGVKYSPFLPIGTTGFRVLMGVKPFLGITRQTLAHLPREGSVTSDRVVDVLNNTYGGDVGAGLAYHWRPGAWIFAELNYRVTGTYSRELRLPDQEPITEGIPWTKWEARGLIVRVGIGF